MSSSCGSEQGLLGLDGTAMAIDTGCLSYAENLDLAVRFQDCFCCAACVCPLGDIICNS